jgi:hypothetical protein
MPGKRPGAYQRKRPGTLVSVAFRWNTESSEPHDPIPEGHPPNWTPPTSRHSSTTITIDFASALHVAHQVGAQFLDGQLYTYVHLRAYHADDGWLPASTAAYIIKLVTDGYLGHRANDSA